MSAQFAQLGFAAWAHTYVALEHEDEGLNADVSWEFADACYGELDPEYVSPHNMEDS